MHHDYAIIRARSLRFVIIVIFKSRNYICARVCTRISLRAPATCRSMSKNEILN